MNHASAEHPNAIRLDALAAGERDEQAARHLDACSGCAAYVEAISKGAAAFAGDDAASDRALLAAVRARAAARPARSSRKRGAWAPAAAALFAVAASLLLVARVRNHPLDGAPGPTPSENTSQPVTASTRLKGGLQGALKGGLQVAVIVEHEGRQSRRSGPLVLARGDRVRLEIALDHQSEVAAGVLADDGEWAELQAPALLPSGAHHSERSVRFEGDVPVGWLLAGPSEDVAKARATRDFVGVVAIPVRGTGP